MIAQRQPRPLVYWVLIALCLVPGALVVASINWLKQQPDDQVFLLSGLAAAVTIFASLALSMFHETRMDEWQRSNARFSTHWGDAVGTSVLALLLSVPPFRDFVVSTMGNWAGVANPDGKLVILTFVGGFMATVMARILCTVVISIGWTFWKSRAPREA